MSLPVSEVATRVWQAPAVLVDQVDRDTAEHLVAVLEEVGLETAIADSSSPPPAPILYDLAVQVVDTGRVGEIVNALSAVLGLEPVQTYELLATPPGSILGSVGEASALALEQRLGPGARILRSPSGEGPYDLFVEPGYSLPPTVLRRLPQIMEDDGIGYIPLGLEHENAEQLWAVLKSHAGARLIPRDLVRFEVILSAPADPDPERIAFLEEAFGIPPAVAAQVLQAAPVSLADDLTLDAAGHAVHRCRALSIPAVREPMYFGRAGVRVDEVKDRTEFNRTLTRLGIAPPDRLPAQIARDLADLEARRLMSALTNSGAKARFTEPVTNGRER
ncbi:MAG: hypothetical protein EA422_02970 [Gemmatimonadales bacterium]|nr:MAG: hypothetical protein EA422_02970 [Gemmatimonadales bacterium]